MKVVTSREMRELEVQAAKIGIAPMILMENAAFGLCSTILNNFPELIGKDFLILCGHGNNGGDGFALARHLYNNSVNVKVLFIKKDGNLPEEAATNLEIIKKMGLFVCETKELNDEAKSLIQSADCLVDAIFGTGLSREVTGVYRDLIVFVNSLSKKVFSVDIPSGISADTGKVLGEAIKAFATISLGLYKIGQLLFPGRSYCGKLFLVDISLPEKLYNNNCCNKLEEKEILHIFKRRQPESHKGSYGHLALIGGSTGKTGAVTMAAKAAMRVGVGLATIVCPHSLNPLIENVNLEVMTLPVGDINGYISFASVDTVKEFLSDKAAVVIGPGLGANEITEEFFISLLNQIRYPVVIDADGINLLSRRIELLKGVETDVVLTPHIGEMQRLLKCDKQKILQNPVNIAKEFATKEKVFLVLKSATTIFATPDGEVFISTFGSPGMATAGVGDVLSGVIGSFLAQGYATKDAVLLSLTLHGLAGELASLDVGDTSLIATDIIDKIPYILKKWEGSNDSKRYNG